MLSVAGVLVAFLVSATLTRRFCDPTSRLHLLDHPNERSLHSRPTPRSGGVAIAGGLAVAIPLWAYQTAAVKPLYGLGAGAVVVAVLSFLDDRRGLPVGMRLAGHMLAAALAVLGGLSLPALGIPGAEWQWPTWLGMTFSGVLLVWMINLYNFMDGMDGLAGGMAVIGFGTYAVLAYLADAPAFMAVNLIIAAAAAGFLLFNLPPARIFMGDTGSSLLGLLAGGMMLWGTQEAVYPFWIALLVFSPFVVDATATLLRRLVRGERIWEAHREHYYQRLVRIGWGHRKTMRWAYLLMLACGASACWAVDRPAVGQWVVLTAWALGYAGLVLLVPALERKVEQR